MPLRGNLLSDFERGQIEALRGEGKTTQQIAQTIKRSFNCVQKAILRSIQEGWW